jgi:AraC family L-rhamnose operon regulatory protein RhaS
MVSHSIFQFKDAVWQHPVHKHNHFEIVLTRHGNGVDYINRNENVYKGSAIFLAGPDKENFFEIAELNRLCLQGLRTLISIRSNSGWFFSLQQPEYLIKSRETHLPAFI